MKPMKFTVRFIPAYREPLPEFIPQWFRLILCKVRGHRLVSNLPACASSMVWHMQKLYPTMEVSQCRRVAVLTADMLRSAERVRVMVGRGEDLSIYASIFGFDEDCGNSPILYRGSHILPADNNKRGGHFGIAAIPGHIYQGSRKASSLTEQETTK